MSETPQSTFTRTGSLGGNRLCPFCFYNLNHQPILKEQEYEILVVRCPECGRVNALDDHPVLERLPMRTGQWANIAWVLVMLVMLAFTVQSIYGWSMLAAYEISQYWEHGSVGFPWWSAESISIWLPHTLLAFIAGCFFSVALSSTSRLHRWFFLGLVIAVIGFVAWSQYAWFEAEREAARNITTWSRVQQTTSLIFLWTMLIGTVALLLGLGLGRRGARRFYRVFMLPRHRRLLPQLLED